MGKLLNDELLEWGESNKKIKNAQFGFIKIGQPMHSLLAIHTIPIIVAKRGKPCS